MLQTRASMEPSRFESGLRVYLRPEPFCPAGGQNSYSVGGLYATQHSGCQQPAWLCLFARLGSRLVRTASGP